MANLTDGRYMALHHTPVSSVPRGCLTVGDGVDGFGTVDQVSMTAYRFGGTWVSFDRVHGKPGPTAGLVAFADGSVFGG